MQTKATAKRATMGLCIAKKEAYPSKQYRIVNYARALQRKWGRHCAVMCTKSNSFQNSLACYIYAIYIMLCSGPQGQGLNDGPPMQHLAFQEDDMTPFCAFQPLLESLYFAAPERSQELSA